ncbi:hypothetical protein PoB_004458800 [Plakobranchus ocellatus]|uniref:Uncharacterized protein n=1 Tax=Plakobranchus ocellatus TaxID=259542 RepID=A0AAV4BEQ9_9GAST|nr:hypothetical protein PoB_004458800 [Plakobranchus ocellatus]
MLASPPRGLQGPFCRGFEPRYRRPGSPLSLQVSSVGISRNEQTKTLRSQKKKKMERFTPSDLITVLVQDLSAATVVNIHLALCTHQKSDFLSLTFIAPRRQNPFYGMEVNNNNKRNIKDKRSNTPGCALT